MPIAAFHRLQQFAGRPGVSLASKGNALELKVSRGDVEVRVLVPESVLEWFVDAESRGFKSRTSDWCDYDGYGDTPNAKLEADMADEVTTFVNQLIERDLRYLQDADGSTSGVLQWFVDGQWKQALPFVVPAA